MIVEFEIGGWKKEMEEDIGVIPPSRISLVLEEPVFCVAYSIGLVPRKWNSKKLDFYFNCYRKDGVNGNVKDFEEDIELDKEKL